MGDEQFQKRLELVRDVIKGYGLEPLDIATVEYEENCPFQYNNFIYKITLSTPATASSIPNPSPYTVAPPQEGVSTLIMRLANPKAEGIVHETRVENEVAAMHLARQGLLSSAKPDTAALVPALYDWQSPNNCPSSFGWSLMEFKDGVPLDGVFRDMPIEDMKEVLGQIADIFTGIQKSPLPESIYGHGGMTIDGEGNIVSAQMTTLKGGPWESYSAFWKARLALRMEDAGVSPALDGWKPNGVRERIDKFLAVGLEKFLDESGVDVGRRNIIHGDLTTNNMLYDPKTKKVTSVLDFDWAFVSHPCHEFFTSLGDIGGNTGGGTGRDPDLSGGQLGKAIITGNFDIPDVPEEALKQLARDKAWDDALAERGALRPSEIEGMSALDELRRLEGLLCPFALEHPAMLKRKTPEEIAEMRKAAEEKLIDCLSSFGY
ncbi:phosphotransferase enzyme family protein [Colletotrichum navitas]|uniref:non-specific serine/threonine protein kinase n=1 Tax=Colletotrichum navitas TaxID=681940 RepID=A0AAD8Q2S3_9PEZI|nr:phosphotransferase enzyme family protein [Colletotrichum navitas]KAK1594191.1 phosphotransferase enzyme family protein [Colletotrichum navitas]